MKVKIVCNRDKEEKVVEDFFENKVYKVFVIEVESAVKGFGVVKLNEFEGAENVAEIVWLGISSDSKRKGLGDKLVKYIEDFCKENSMRKIYIKTNVDNKSGVCFWIMEGYKFEARLLDFTAKSYDDYYLGKNI